MRIAEYIVGCGDEHSLILAPKSLQLIARSDASYAEHKDGRSHTGGCIGFESDSACWFTWVSSKQPVVALSTCESELIATSTIGCGVEWGVGNSYRNSDMFSSRSRSEWTISAQCIC